MRSINRYAALKTAIANGDEKSVEELLPVEPMVEMEKLYLIELAELNRNSKILELLQSVPTDN